MGDTIKPWSDTRSESPVELPNDLADKNVRLLNPLAAPDLYFELYDNAAKRVTITDPETNEAQNYELVANVNNPETSSHFKVIKNPDTGHHVLIGKGMDLLGRNEGAGALKGVYEDLWQQENAEDDGCITGQVIDGEKAYLELLQNPDVKSIEVIGYSIGSIPANYLASVYDAKITNIADLGVPHTGRDEALGFQKWTAENFNVCAKGMFPGAHGEFKDNLNQNTIGLALRGDTMGGALGGVGLRFGEQIVLDKGDLNWLGFAHVPQIYADSARELHNAPETTVTEKLEGDTWQPLEKSDIPTGGNGPGS